MQLIFNRHAPAAVAAAGRPAPLPQGCAANDAKKRQLPSSAIEVLFLRIAVVIMFY